MYVLISLFFLFLSPFVSRGLPSVIQPAAPIMPRQWSVRSFPCPKQHLSKCAEKHNGHHPVSLTDPDSNSAAALISVFFISSTPTSPPNPTSSPKLFPSPNYFPATAPKSESKSAVTSDKFPTSLTNTPPASLPLTDANTTPSTSAAAPCPVSSSTLQIHLLWLLVPPSLLSSSELLLGTGSESAAFCTPPSRSLRHYHSQ